MILPKLLLLKLPFSKLSFLSKLVLSINVPFEDANSQYLLSPAPPPDKPDHIKLIDLGFAQQRGFSWHPALKVGLLARGTHVKVTFFGTGQSGTVDNSKWSE